MSEGGKFDEANSISSVMLNKFKRRKKTWREGGGGGEGKDRLPEN